MKTTFNSPLRIMKYVSTIILVVGLVGYVLYQARDVISGPAVAFSIPQNGASVKHSLINVRGHAENVSFIHLNGRQIYVNDEGVFNEQLLLADGYNIIEVSAEGRFGREVSETHEIIYLSPKSRPPLVDADTDRRTTIYPAFTNRP